MMHQGFTYKDADEGTEPKHHDPDHDYSADRLEEVAAAVVSEAGWPHRQRDISSSSARSSRSS